MTQEANKRHVREKKDTLPPPHWGKLHEDIGHNLVLSVSEVLKLDFLPQINLSNIYEYIEPEPTPHYFWIDADTKRHHYEAHYSPEDQIRIVQTYLERIKRGKPDLIPEDKWAEIIALFKKKRNLPL